MNLRDTIQKIIEEQGDDIIKKTSFVGMMDDYGAFTDESPAVREVFRKLAQNNYFEKVTLMSKKTLEFDMKSMIFDISSKYGYQNTVVADVLKEVAFGIKLITSDKDWSGIANSLNPIQSSSSSSSTTTEATTSSPSSTHSVQTSQKKKSFWSFLNFGGSDEFKIKKYVDEKTGYILPKLDQLSLSASIPKFEQKANANSAEANYLLGLIYYEGKGVKIDYKKAFTYFKKAADLGFSFAQNMLGLCYEQGKGVLANSNEAAQWYYKAASQKMRLAIKNLGQLYHNIGNDQEALLWLKKAADQSDGEAMFLMAEIYYRGKSGLKNDKEAFKYYSAASVMHHHLQSTYMLGMMISRGHGIDQNPEYAAQFFQKAAEKGHVDAQYELGCYYWEKWRAIPVSFLPKPNEQQKKEDAIKNQAHYWLKKAKDNGHQAAKKLFDKIYW